MLVVLDTNVLVSGLLNGSGSPGQILDLLLDGKLQIAYDDRILGEYEDVLARPQLHLDHSQVDAVISYLELSGKFTEAESVSAAGYPDPDDLPFVEVFITARAECLISGNLRHFAPLLEKGAKVYSPKQFLSYWG